MSELEEKGVGGANTFASESEFSHTSDARAPPASTADVTVALPPPSILVRPRGLCGSVCRPRKPRPLDHPIDLPTRTAVHPEVLPLDDHDVLRFVRTLFRVVPDHEVESVVRERVMRRPPVIANDARSLEDLFASGRNVCVALAPGFKPLAGAAVYKIALASRLVVDAEAERNASRERVDHLALLLSLRTMLATLFLSSLAGTTRVERGEAELIGSDYEAEVALERALGALPKIRVLECELPFLRALHDGRELPPVPHHLRTKWAWIDRWFAVRKMTEHCDLHGDAWARAMDDSDAILRVIIEDIILGSPYVSERSEGGDVLILDYGDEAGSDGDDAGADGDDAGGDGDDARADPSASGV